MGVFATASKLVLYPAAFLVLIAVIPGLPPYFQVGEMSLPPELREFEGALARNNLLDKLELVPGSDIAEGPDSIAIDGETIYFGSVNGVVYKSDGKTTKKVGQTGEPCDPVWEPRKCGCVLGMRLGPDKNLVIVDSFRGLVRMNTKTGKTETVVELGANIEGVTIKFPDDMDLSQDGSTAYWSTITSTVEPEMVVSFQEILSGVPSGALIKTDLKTKKSTVLIRDISMANGVVLSKNEDFVLLGDSLQSRILRYYLKGEKKGTWDVFVDRLPGIPDNLSSNGKDGFLIPILFPRDDSLVTLSKYPILRKLIIRIEALVYLAVKVSAQIFGQNHYLGQVKLFLKNLFVASFDKEVRATVIEVNSHGEILRSFHTDKSSVRMITNVEVGDKYVYVGRVHHGVFKIPRSELNL